MLHLQMGSFRQAAESYLQLEGVAQSIGSDRWLSLAHSGMSDAARNLGDTAAALVHAERACTLARHFGPSMELGVATRALGDANLSLARFEEARDQFALCIPMLEEWKDQEDLALARQGHERAMRELDFREGHVPS
jgi:tetratricopeptide (TPR) repeat protein